MSLYPVFFQPFFLVVSWPHTSELLPTSHMLNLNKFGAVPIKRCENWRKQLTYLNFVSVKRALH